MTSQAVVDDEVMRRPVEIRGLVAAGIGQEIFFGIMTVTGHVQPVTLTATPKEVAGNVVMLPDVVKRVV